MDLRFKLRILRRMGMSEVCVSQGVQEKVN